MVLVELKLRWILKTYVQVVVVAAVACLSGAYGATGEIVLHSIVHPFPVSQATPLYVFYTDGSGLDTFVPGPCSTFAPPPNPPEVLDIPPGPEGSGPLVDVSFTTGNRLLRLWADGSVSLTPTIGGDSCHLLYRCNPADIDWDGQIDFDDLAKLLADWGPYDGGVPRPLAAWVYPDNNNYTIVRNWTDGTSEAFCFGDWDDCGGSVQVSVFRSGFGSAFSDIDGNGVVEFSDLVLLLSAWGPC